MRGKVYAVFAVLSPTGITPAYAGKSWKISIYAPDEWDHPRLCGEKIYTYRKSTGRQGSPPPMRGKVGNRLKSNFIHGITPAYAGKSPKGYAKAADQQGSPPPMRGKDDIRETSVPFDRITPAYAGKSILFTIGGELYGDHPRLCGEKSHKASMTLHRSGSPPPMRGKGFL